VSEHVEALGAAVHSVRGDTGEGGGGGGAGNLGRSAVVQAAGDALFQRATTGFGGRLLLRFFEQGAVLTGGAALAVGVEAAVKRVGGYGRRR